jgi:hypothetical protein
MERRDRHSKFELGATLDNWFHQIERGQLSPPLDVTADTIRNARMHHPTV